jgi:ubiquinone/menaquinone biosynthesis C-methylase UbiE
MWDLEGFTMARAKQMMGAHSTTDEGLEAAGRRYAEEIRKYITPDSRVLDLGCGIGRIALYVAPHCAELHAVDASPRILQHARQRLKALGNVRFTKVNGTDLRQFAKDSLDFCYCIQVFHQIEREHTMRYLVELSRVIRPGGSVYLHFMSFEDPRNAAQFREYSLESKVLRISRRRFFTPAEISVFAGLAGFVDASITQDDDSLILTAKIPMAVDRTDS